MGRNSPLAFAVRSSVKGSPKAEHASATVPDLTTAHMGMFEVKGQV